MRDWPRFDDAVCLLLIVSPLSKPGTNIALGLCAATFLRDWHAQRRRPRATPLDGAILAWVVASVLSGVTSIDPLRSFRDLRNIGHWGVYFFSAWAVASGASLRRLENAWLVAGVVTAGQALLQGAFGFDLLGRGSTVPTGFFGGHLELGHYMVILLGLAIARWSDASSPRDAKLALLAVMVLGAGLVLSRGRGPWLAFIAVAVSLGVVRKSWHAIGALAAVCALQLVFLARQPQGLSSFYRSYVTFDVEEQSQVPEEQVTSNVWRVVMWREGLRFFALRPVTGTGVETTGELSQDFRTPFHDLAVAHLHSNYFEILMTRGFFGLAAFFLLLIIAAQTVTTALAGSSAGDGRAALFVAFAAIVAHVVHGLTHFTFGSTWIQVGFYIALGLGVGEILRRRDRAKSGALSWPDPRSLRWAIPAVAVTMLAQPWLSDHPTPVIVLGVFSLLDVGTRWALKRTDVIDAALACSFAFIAVTSFVLLVQSPDTEEVGRRVIVAGTLPFAVCQLAHRLARGSAATVGIQAGSKWS